MPDLKKKINIHNDINGNLKKLVSICPLVTGFKLVLKSITNCM